jgi:hypothetical protein
MKSILITNLGNRHIKKDGDYLNRDNFRNETRDLLQVLRSNFEETSERIDINMILHVLQEDGILNTVETTYLIYTDQGTDSKFSKSDTVYEAEIIQLILEKEHEEASQLIHFKGNPANAEEAFKGLATLLRPICRQHADKRIIFIDAGGTSQLKTASRELLRYYVPEERLNIRHVAESGEVTDASSDTLKRYHLLGVARKFVDLFQYAEALQVLKQVPERSVDRWPLTRLVEALAWRKNFEFHRAKQRVDALAQNDHGVPELDALIRRFAAVYNQPSSCAFQSLNEDENQAIYELASICQLYFNKPDYTLGVVTYYRLCEEICSAFLQCETYDTNVPEMLDRCCKDASNDKQILPLFKHIQPTRGLNHLRNTCFLAHENHPVTLEKILKEDRFFMSQTLPELWRLLGLPETNLYKQLNGKLHDLFLAE